MDSPMFNPGPGRAEPGQWPGFLDDPETLMSQYASQVSKVFASRILPRFRVHPRCCARNRWDSWRLHSSLSSDFSTSASQFLQRSSFSRENVIFCILHCEILFPFFVRVDSLLIFHRFDLKFRILVHTPRDYCLWRCFFWNLQFVSNGIRCRGCGRLAVLGFGLVLWREYLILRHVGLGLRVWFYFPL